MAPTPSPLELSPLKITVIGGSNSVLKTGYIGHIKPFLERAGYDPKINNMAIGANTSLRGLLSSYSANGDADVYICEYFVNDSILYRRSGEATWMSVYESMLRVLKKKNPNAVFVLPLLGRSDEKFWGTQESMREKLGELAGHYGLVITDIDEDLHNTLGSEFRKAYSDGAHFKPGLTNRYAAARIAMDISTAVAAKRSHRSLGSVESQPLPQRLSRFDMDQSMSISAIGFAKDYEVVDFSNSKYSVKALRLPLGETLHIPMDAIPLAIGFITAKGACDLLCEKNSGDITRIHTLHETIQDGTYSFLIRTLGLTTKNWHRRDNWGGIKISAISGSDRPDQEIYKEYRMVANETAEPQALYLTFFACSLVPA